MAGLLSTGQDTGVAAPSISVEEHLARVTALLAPAEVVSLPLADCLGLALAEDLHAPMALPPFDNSAMDGYAVRACDILGAGRDAPLSLPVTQDIPAGHTDPRPLRAGTAHRIMTGAPMPVGADAVVAVEETDAGTETVQVFAEVAARTHVRYVGEDVATGGLCLPAGTEIGPAAIGLAAAVGSADLPVRRRLRVLILSTGTELVEPGTALRHGQIYESNGKMLAAAVRAAGGTPTLLRSVADDVEQFHATLRPELAGTDLIVTSGGVSAGAYEVVKDAFTEQGVDFYRVAMQPGGPQGCGRFSGVPVITLPGNPVSTGISFEIFVRPAMRSAMGFARPRRQAIRARLSEEVTSLPGRSQFRRGLFDYAAGTVALHGGPGSHLLTALATSNVLVVLEPDDVHLPAGAEVEVLPLP